MRGREEVFLVSLLLSLHSWQPASRTATGEPVSEGCLRCPRSSTTRCCRHRTPGSMRQRPVRAARVQPPRARACCAIAALRRCRQCLYSPRSGRSDERAKLGVTTATCLLWSSTSRKAPRPWMCRHAVRRCSQRNQRASSRCSRRPCGRRVRCQARGRAAAVVAWHVLSPMWPAPNPMASELSRAHALQMTTAQTRSPGDPDL
jgi:hypothetical protein